jgi:hypothetical protein
MALKPQIDITRYEVSFYATGVMTKGGILCATATPGSGAAYDSSNMIVEYAASPSGRNPIGVLLYDVVNQDVTDQPLNRHKHLALVNTKVPIGTQGSVVTNNIFSGATASIGAGATAYAGPSGQFTNTSVWPYYGTAVGKFMSRVDQDGYCRVAISTIA